MADQEKKHDWFAILDEKVSMTRLQFLSLWFWLLVFFGIFLFGNR